MLQGMFTLAMTTVNQDRHAIASFKLPGHNLSQKITARGITTVSTANASKNHLRKEVVSKKIFIFTKNSV